MLLQSTFIQSPLHHHVSLSSSSSHPSPISSGFRGSTIVRTITAHNHPKTIACSISQVHNYGTVDYEKRPPMKWNSVYKRISMMEDPEVGSATVLNMYEKDGKKLSKWELCRIVKELRKFKRFKLALEVYEWMNNRGDRFRMSSSDTAIQLDLIAKVRGISNAEDYFLNLPDTVKDKRTFGALLNAYVHGRVREKAESLLDKMRSKGYAMHPLPFNVMMGLYMNSKDYDKVDSLISEMMEKNISLDIYSYNIWLSCHGSQGSVEKMEQIFERMKLNRTINPNWTTFSTMATMYLKLGLMGKAEECLRNVESRITGRDRIPYHYLISLYGGIGNKEEVHRVWNLYKSVFPTIPNMGYHAVISSLVRMDDIEGAEKIYDEWLSIKTAYDPRIVNILLSCYVKKGSLETAESLFEQMVGMGGKPNASTWEILAEGHTRERRISEALSCLKEATSAERSKGWKPKPANICSLLNLCEQEADTASKEAVFGILRQVGCFNDEAYMSYLPISTTDRVPYGEELLAEKAKTDSDDDGNISDGAEMLLNQLQGSL